MFKCFKCNKEFKYESKLNEHKNRKTECNKIKNKLKCDICNVDFQRPAEQNRHEKTKKHKNYINAKEHGLEYFQCNLDILKNDISRIINE